MLAAVLVFQGCHGKEPYMSWPPRAGFHSVTALTAKSVKSVCQQGQFLLEALRECHAVPFPLDLRQLLTMLGIGAMATELPSGPQLWPGLPLCILACFVSHPLRGTPVIVCRACSNPE